MATNIRSPYKLIRFDTINHQLEKPTLLLKTRGGKYLGKIDYDNLNFSFVAQGLDEISFDVHKSKNGQGTIKNTNGQESLWDKLRDLCIIDYVGYGQFEAHVTVNESNETIKSVQAESVETELGQRLLYEIHINDDKYFEKYTLEENKNKEQVAITFKNDNPALSLLDIVLEKAPHWSIERIDPLFNAGGYVYPPDGMQRTFSPSDGTSIYDFLTGEVAQEFGCAFLFDTYNRKIYVKNIDGAVYNKTTHKVQEDIDFWLETVSGETVVHYYYKTTGDPVPQVVADTLAYVDGIGDDTNIFVSPNKLAKDMSADSDKGAIKNCFRVSGGDDVITNMIGAADATGNNYIYMFDQFQYDDMTPELSTKFKAYQTYLEQQTDLYQQPGGVYIYDPDGYFDPETNCCYHRTSALSGDKLLHDAIYKNNKVYVLDTKAYKDGDVYYDRYGEVIPSNTVEYNTPGLYNQYQQLLDRANWLEHEMFPNTELDNPEASQVFDDLVTTMGQTKVYVQNSFKTNDYTHILSTAEKTLGAMADTRYDVKILRNNNLSMTKTSEDSPDGVLGCDVQVTRSVNSEDTYTGHMTVDVHKVDSKDDPDLFKQKLNLAIAKMDIAELNLADNMTKAELIAFFRKYNITTLKSYRDGFESCLSALDDLYVQAGGESSTMVTIQEYNRAKALYNLRVDAVNEVLGKENYNAQGEIISYTPGYLDDLNNLNLAIEAKQTEIKTFQDALDIETYLDDDDLYKEFCSYIREQEYNNSNYSSEGLSDVEILDKANELLDTAKKELSKACVSQKTVSGNINDIFALPELSTLYEKFALYNYIRCRIDDRIYKLRLMQIDFSQDSPADLTVTFSDVVEDVTGVGDDIESVLNKASAIATSYNYVTNQAEKGKMASSTFADIKQEGLNAAEYILKNSDNEDVTVDQTGILLKSETDVGFYGQHQTRITGNGMYLTSDAWNSIDMAVGLGRYNGQDRYGVWADVLVGDMIAGQQLNISSNDGKVRIDGTGIHLSGGQIDWDTNYPIPANAMDDIPTSQVIGLDAQTTTFVNAISDLNDDVDNLQAQIDGDIITWFYNYEPLPSATNTSSNEPASNWNTEALQITHEGDIFYNSQDGSAYRYVYDNNSHRHYWTIITDEAIADALATANHAQDTADHKRRVFYTTPYVPYDQGDLWSQGSNGDLMICITPKTENQTYSASDWSKATKYTDDTALTTFVNGAYATTIADINTQIDGKADTFYQSNAPHSEYTNIPDNETYNLYVGDLWYNTSTNKSYQYVKSANGSNFNYKWQEIDGVPDAVYDKIDQRKAIFVAKPSTPNTKDDGYCYRVNDMWILESHSSSDNTYPNYPNGTIVIATQSSKTYSVSHWVKKDNYTDYAEYTAAKQALENSISDLNTNKASVASLTTFQTSVGNWLGVNGTTEVTQRAIVSPYIAGGYLYITSPTQGDLTSVEINPERHAHDGIISANTSVFKITNSAGDPVIYMDDEGNANFEGIITAEHGHIGDWTIGEGSLQSESGLGTIALESTQCRVWLDNNKFQTILDPNGLSFIKDQQSTHDVMSIYPNDNSGKSIAIVYSQLDSSLAPVSGSEYQIVNFGKNNVLFTTDVSIVESDLEIQGGTATYYADTNAIARGSNEVVSGWMVYSYLYNSYTPSYASLAGSAEEANTVYISDDISQPKLYTIEDSVYTLTANIETNGQLHYIRGSTNNYNVYNLYYGSSNGNWTAGLEINGNIKADSFSFASSPTYSQDLQDGDYVLTVNNMGEIVVKRYRRNN